jgi:hypothetical protein
MGSGIGVDGLEAEKITGVCNHPRLPAILFQGRQLTLQNPGLGSRYSGSQSRSLTL